MLRFKRLYFEGAGPYPKCEVPLEGLGVVAVLGRNGSGKSTIFKVLDQILFGTAKDAIINRHDPSLGYYGEVEFEVDSRHYRIEQSRKHPRTGSGMSVYEDGHDITRKNLRNIEKQVQEILGFSREEFCNCVYLADLQSSTLLYGTPSQRDSYLSALFHLDIFDEILEIVKEDHASVCTLLEGKQKTVFTFDDLKDRLRDLKCPDESELEEIKARLQKKEKTFRKLQARYKTWVEIATKFKQRREILDRIEEIGEVEEVSDDTIEKLESTLRKAEKSEAVSSQRRAIRAKMAELPEVDGDLDELEEKLKKAEKKLAAREAKIDGVEKRESIIEMIKEIEEKEAEVLQTKHNPKTIEDDLERVSSEVVRCEVEIDTLERRYKALSRDDEAKCPTCGSEIEDKEKLLDQLKEKRKEIKHKHEKYSGKIKTMKRLREVASRLMDYKSKLRDLPEGTSKEVEEDINSYSKLVSKLREQVKAANLRSMLERQLQELPKVEKEVDPDEIRTKLTKLRKRSEKFRERSRLEKSLEGLPDRAPKEKHLNMLSGKIEEVSEEITSLTLKQENYSKSISEYKTLKKKLKAMKKKMKRAKRYRVEEAALAGLKSAFSRTGLRMFALRRVLKAITSALPKYINLLFGENKLKVKMAEDTFDFTVWRDKVEIAKTMLSKGEKARLALALLLATRQAVPVKKRSNILIIDEILDGLDIEGVPAVFSAFDYLQSVEKVSTIFIISPMTKLFEDEALSSRLDQKWIASKHKNTSTLEMTSGPRSKHGKRSRKDHRLAHNT